MKVKVMTKAWSAWSVGGLLLWSAACANADPPGDVAAHQAETAAETATAAVATETDAPSAAAPLSTRTIRETHENLHAVLWMQYAAEYRAACLQTYRQAQFALDRALADPSWTAAIEQVDGYEAKPPAVIVDVDETVLDNTSFEVGLIRTGQFYASETWDPWVLEARAKAVPGALEFCRYAADKRVAVFYVTNRKDHLREATRKNLQSLGFPLIADSRESILTRSDVSDKGPRRAQLAESYRILLLAGDNLGDFLSETKADNAARAAMVDAHAGYWGERWFMIPNPVYGDWEGALFDFDYSIPDEEELRRKYERLID